MASLTFSSFVLIFQRKLSILIMIKLARATPATLVVTIATLLAKRAFVLVVIAMTADTS
jgi:hypothetical protein